MLKGILLIVGAAACWGMGGVSGQYLYQYHQADAVWLVMVRQIIGGLLFLSFAAVVQKQNIVQALRSNPRDLLEFSFLGILGAQLGFYYTIALCNAATATVLQYMAPIYVMLWMSYKNRRLPEGRELLGIVGAVAGVFLIATHGSLDSLALSPAALSIGLASAVSYAYYSIKPVAMLQKYYATVIIGWGQLLSGLFLLLWRNPFAPVGSWDTAAVLVMALVAGILGMVLVRGIPHISWKFLTTTASVLKGTDGILPAILNTLYVILLTLLIVLPLGVGAAVYLTEYAQNRKVISVIEFTNETLAGIPSIIYGLVGMLVFAQTLGFQTCLLSGSLTLVIMNLPTIIRTTQESLKTVPQGYREGALGLGAGKWHIIRTIVLPCSIDGIVTGCILAVGRIVGESAALLFTAGAAEVIANGVLKAYTSNGATLSVLLYLRAFEDGDFDSAWAIGAVLLVLVLAINLAARLAKTKLKQKQ